MLISNLILVFLNKMASTKWRITLCTIWNFIRSRYLGVFEVADYESILLCRKTTWRIKMADHFVQKLWDFNKTGSLFVFDVADLESDDTFSKNKIASSKWRITLRKLWNFNT